MPPAVTMIVTAGPDPAVGWRLALRFGARYKLLSCVVPGFDVPVLHVMAVIAGLLALKLPCALQIRSFSADLVKTALNPPDDPLWAEISRLTQTGGHTVSWHHIAYTPPA